MVKKFTQQELTARAYPLTVFNVVSNFTVGDFVDIEIQVELFNARLDKKVFPACVSSCMNSGTKNSFFKSGQIIIAGAKSYYHALLAAQMCAMKLRRDFGFPYRIYNFQIKNIVCSSNLGFAIDLDLFYQMKKANAYFDQENFGGLNYVLKKDDWKVTITAFDQGAIVVTGIKNIQHMKQIEDELKIFRAFEYKKDFRTVPIPIRDAYYGTTEWRKWGLDNSEAAIKRTLFNKQMKKKRKRQLLKIDKTTLKVYCKMKQKKAENEMFMQVKTFKQSLAEAGVR